MEIQVLLENKGVVYDATPVLVEEVIWESSVLGEAGKLQFSVMRDGVLNFVEGSVVQLFVDGVLAFRGWVMTKERTSAQIISVTAYDQVFYLAKNKETLVYYDKTASEVVRLLADKHGLQVGEVSDSGWKIPQRIEEGQSLLDMILSAILITKEATGKEFFFFDRGGMLCLKEASELGVQVFLGVDGGIREYWYKTDISTDTYNTVKLYHAGRNETEQLAYQAEQADKVSEWGKLQYYKHIAYGLSDGQMKEMANAVLGEKCRVKKTLTVENLNGDWLLYAGNTIGISIPDLAEIGIQGQALITWCKHTFKDGEHRTMMRILVEG